MKDLRQHVGKQVIVETDTLTVKGRLTHFGAQSITLQDTTVLADADAGKPMDGLVVFPDDRVAWIQVLG